MYIALLISIHDFFLRGRSEFTGNEAGLSLYVHYLFAIIAIIASE